MCADLISFFHIFLGPETLSFSTRNPHTSANKNRVFCFLIGDKKTETQTFTISPCAMHDFSQDFSSQKPAKNQNNQKMKFAKISHVSFLPKKRTFTPNNLLKRESWHEKKIAAKEHGKFPNKIEEFHFERRGIDPNPEVSAVWRTSVA